MRGPEAELRSLMFQVGRVRKGPIPPDSVRERARRLLYDSYHEAGVSFCSENTYLGWDLTDAGIRLRVEAIVDGGRIKSDANPGVPLVDFAKTNGNVIEDFRGLLIELCCARLRLWRDTPHSYVLGLSPQQMIELGLADAVRLFVKNEPHSREKLDQGRFRLISSMSLINQVCERFLYTELNDREVDHWDVCPSAIGIGFTNDMNFDVWRRLYAVPGKMQNDVSGWDFNVYCWKAMDATEVNIQLKRASEMRANMMRNATWAIMDKVFALSDGRLLITNEPGIMTSGSFITGQLNSKMRQLAKVHAALKNFPDLERAPFGMACGDDCIEQLVPGESLEQRVAAYTWLGFRLTDVAEVDKSFEFCSHFYLGGSIAPLTTWPRCFYRLICNQPALDLMAQFKFELRHNLELGPCLEVLAAIGWIPPDPVEVLGGVRVQTCVREVGTDKTFLDRNEMGRTKKSKVAVPQDFRPPSMAHQQKAAHAASRAIPAIPKQTPAQREELQRRALALHVKPMKGPNVARNHPAWEKWVRALARPFDHRGVQCPVNANPAPSNIVLSPSVLANDLNITVASNATRQIVLFPGHGVQSQGALGVDNATAPAGTTYKATAGPGDEFAVHSRLQSYSATSVVPVGTGSVGPVPYNLGFSVSGVETPYTMNPMLGLVSGNGGGGTDLPAGYATCFTCGAVSGGVHWDPIPPDVPVGLTGQSSSGHMRHKLTSMGVRVVNQTPVAERGGNIVTVQPTNKFYNAGTGPNYTFHQSAMDLYPTYRVHSNQCDLSWVPRPEDLAFSHPAVGTASEATLTDALLAEGYCYTDHAAIYVFLNNPTANAQTYTLEIVQNYDLAGQGVTQLGQEAEHHPQLLPAVQKGIAVATGTGSHIGQAMVDGAKSALMNAAGEVSARAQSSLTAFAKTLPGRVAGAFGAAAGAAMMAA